MPFVPANRVVQANLRYTLGSEKVENTLYFRHADAWSVVGLANLGTQLYTWWNTNLKTSQGTVCTLREIYMRDLTTENSLVSTYTDGLPSAGTVAGDCVPFNCSLCISFRTGFAGRSRRGRNYTVGMMEAHQGNSIVTNGYALAMQTAYEELLTFGSLYGFEWVIVSRYQGGDPRPSAVVTPVQAVVIVDLAVDSQRRRLPGRGQ